MNEANTSSSVSFSPHKHVSRLFGQYVVKYKFQFKFSIIIFIFLAVSAFSIWAEGHLAVKNLIATNMISDPQAIENLHILNDIVAKTSMMALAMTFGLSIFFSHFIAGPIYRFEKTLEGMREGNLNLFVRLRKHDEFKDTAELFNQTLVSLRKKLEKERESVTQLTVQLRSLQDDLSKAGRTAESAQVESLLKEFNQKTPQIKI